MLLVLLQRQGEAAYGLWYGPSLKMLNAGMAGIIRVKIFTHG